MAEDEKKVTKCFLIEKQVSSAEGANIEISSVYLSVRALKRRKLNSWMKDHFDIPFMLPTSTICEYALNDRRKGVMTSNFKRQMFLHANRQYWSVDDVNVIVNK